MRTDTALILVGMAGAALYLVGAFDGLTEPDDEMPQGVSVMDQTLSYFDPNAWSLAQFFGLENDTVNMNDSNVQAFLRVIRYAEGTSGPNGYRQIFATRGGPNLFDSWEDHPRVAKQFKVGSKTLWTSAAGAYQFMAVSPRPEPLKPTSVNTWDRLKAKLGLPDFSPASQDRAAVELISEAGALQDVLAGRFDQAISKCRGIWASLPGATYGQPTKDLGTLRNVYAANGGTITRA